MFKSKKEMIREMMVDGEMFEHKPTGYICKFDPECINDQSHLTSYSPFVCRPKVSTSAEGDSWRPMDSLWSKYAEITKAPKVLNDISHLPDLEIDTKVQVRERPGDDFDTRYFKEFDENGSMWCFLDGRTSQTSKDDDVLLWKFWKLDDEPNKPSITSKV